MIYVRENLNYNRLALKFVHSAHGEVGVGCYLIPLPRNMKSPTSTDTAAAHAFYCLSDVRTERLIQDSVYLPLYVHSLTHSPTRVNETTAANKRGNR